MLTYLPAYVITITFNTYNRHNSLMKGLVTNNESPEILIQLKFKQSIKKSWKKKLKSCYAKVRSVKFL